MTDTDNVIHAFTADQVKELTGLSNHQLRYWDNTGFFSPKLAHEIRRAPFSRIYSFRDVVGLRVISILRKSHQIPLQTLRKVAKELKKHDSAPWSGLKLYVVGKEVHFREPRTGQMREALSGQYVEKILLQNIIDDVKEASRKLMQRKPEQIGRVERHRFVAHNAWTLAGTRVPTKAIREFHDAGYSIKQIIAEYPNLTVRDIEAALEHEEALAESA